MNHADGRERPGYRRPGQPARHRLRVRKAAPGPRTSAVPGKLTLAAPGTAYLRGPGKANARRRAPAQPCSATIATRAAACRRSSGVSSSMLAIRRSLS